MSAVIDYDEVKTLDGETHPAPPALTVAALIAELEKQPQDRRVLVEGCDCVGVARSVGLDSEDVVILR